MSAYGYCDERTERYAAAFEEQVTAEFKAHRAARRIAAGLGLGTEWNEGPAASFYDPTTPETKVGVHKQRVWVDDPAGGLVLTFAYGGVFAKASERGAPSAEMLTAVRAIGGQVAAAVSTISPRKQGELASGPSVGAMAERAAGTFPVRRFDRGVRLPMLGVPPAPLELPALAS